MGDEIAKEIIYNNSHGALSVYERLSTHNVTSDTNTVDINIDYSNLPERFSYVLEN